MVKCWLMMLYDAYPAQVNYCQHHAGKFILFVIQSLRWSTDTLLGYAPSDEQPRDSCGSKLDMTLHKTACFKESVVVTLHQLLYVFQTTCFSEQLWQKIWNVLSQPYAKTYQSDSPSQL